MIDDQVAFVLAETVAGIEKEVHRLIVDMNSIVKCPVFWFRLIKQAPQRMKEER